MYLLFAVFNSGNKFLSFVDTCIPDVVELVLVEVVLLEVVQDLERGSVMSEKLVVVEEAMVVVEGVEAAAAVVEEAEAGQIIAVVLVAEIVVGKVEDLQEKDLVTAKEDISFNIF